MKYKCPCCGYFTLEEAKGKYEICPVCFWEDDPKQAKDEEYEGGANRVSLKQARENFKLYGACNGMEGLYCVDGKKAMQTICINMQVILM